MCTCYKVHVEVVAHSFHGLRASMNPQITGIPVNLATRRKKWAPTERKNQFFKFKFKIPFQKHTYLNHVFGFWVFLFFCFWLLMLYGYTSMLFNYSVSPFLFHKLIASNNRTICIFPTCLYHLQRFFPLCADVSRHHARLIGK